MTTTQASTIYRGLRVDASHDVSGDQLELSIDGGATWNATGVTAVATADRTPEMVAADAATPPAAGLTGYWWKVLTGPGTPYPLPTGTARVRGRLTDTPEIVRLAWSIEIKYGE